MLILLVFVALLAVTDTMRRWHRSIDERLSSDAHGILARRDDVFGRALMQPLGSLRLLASLRVVARGNPAEIATDLASWKANLPDVADIYVILPDGRGVASSEGGVPDKVLAAYLGAQAGSAPSLAIPRIVTLGEQPLALIGVPLPGAAGGAVIAAFKLHDMLGPLLVRLPGANARLLILDDQNRVLVNGFADTTDADGDLSLVRQVPHAAALMTTLAGQAITGSVVDGQYIEQQQEYRYFVSRMRSTGWTIAYIQPEKDLLAAYSEAKYFGWVQLIVVLFAALLLVAMMHRLVLRPLQTLARGQAAMKDGAMPKPVEVPGSGEFAAMAESYNRLVANLTASEQRLRTIFEAFPESVVVFRLSDSALLDVNQAFLNKVGLSREEVLGRSGGTIGLLPDESAATAHRAALLEKGSLERQVIRMQMPNGEERWSMYSSRLIEFDGVPASLSVTVDVTQLKLAEAQIRQSEARFAALFQMAPVPMSFTHEREQFSHTHWNDAWYHTFGFLPEEAEDRGGDALGIWVDPGQRRQLIQGVLDEGHVHAFEVNLRRRDGAIRQHVLFADKVETVDGKAMIVAYVDVTDSRQAEAELRASEETRHAIFNASPVAMLVSDISRDFSVVDANQAWLRQFQRTLPEIVGLNGGQINFWANEVDRERVIAQIEQDGLVSDYEAEFVRGDGSRLLCRVGARRVQVDGRELLVMLQEDITALRQMERERQEAEIKLRRFSFMVSHTNDAVFLNDNGITIDCNEAALRIFESPRERFIGQSPAVFSPLLQANGELSSTLALTKVRAALAGEPQRFEWVHTKGDGTPFYVEVALSSFEEDGRSLIVGVVRDITERKRAEAEIWELNATLEERVALRTRELAEANTNLGITLTNLQRAQDELLRTEKLASLGAMVAGIAHELNTPIGNAVTVATTLLDEHRHFTGKMAAGLTRSALERFLSVVGEAGQIVERNLYRAAELIGSFKQLAVDQSSYQRRSFDLQEVVHEITLAMAPTIRRSPYQLIDEVPAGLVFDSYPGPLGQILINLINNALIHAFVGRDSGQVRIAAEAAEPGWIIMTVSDDGCGISAEHQKQIFDPFFTTRLGQGGSGLGLHIVFSLVVDLLGGRVHVISASGEGARFVVHLPSVAPAGEQHNWDSE
ncbi:PAS domain S-box protein [Ferribacterium limneticum]|uniref:PAS domain S-box protein n=1 Tax=Ferribacterium limneticum TaxID=76259 RepID=UPI001CFA009A|nr:PAS domain S-box protein [Ferribacterium limneticum]UCV29919.1 PAS domain S-box protein [Ferribacterium limneticum]UCV33838.1 PAS domain S-box protein [Ferribacterium limneticum]